MLEVQGIWFKAALDRAEGAWKEKRQCYIESAGHQVFSLGKIQPQEVSNANFDGLRFEAGSGVTWRSVLKQLQRCPQKVPSHAGLGKFF